MNRMIKNFFSTVLTLALVAVSTQNLQAQGPTMGKQTLAMMEASPAGSNVVAFFKTLNENKPVTDEQLDAIISKALIDKYGKAEIKTAVFQDIRDNDGAITVYMVNRTARNKYEVYARGTVEAEAWLKMEFTLDENTPYKVRGVGVEVVDAAPEGVGDKPMKIG